MVSSRLIQCAVIARNERLNCDDQISIVKLTFPAASCIEIRSITTSAKLWEITYLQLFFEFRDVAMKFLKDSLAHPSPVGDVIVAKRFS